MASYDDDGYSFGSGKATETGESFGTNAMGKASDFTIPLVVSGQKVFGDIVESAQIIVSGSPVMKGGINVVMVLIFVYCVMAFLFPRQLRAVLRGLYTTT